MGPYGKGAYVDRVREHGHQGRAFGWGRASSHPCPHSLQCARGKIREYRGVRSRSGQGSAEFRVKVNFFQTRPSGLEVIKKGWVGQP